LAVRALIQPANRAQQFFESLRQLLGYVARKAAANSGANALEAFLLGVIFGAVHVSILTSLTRP
jgi:hypothetical protein